MDSKKLLLKCLHCPKQSVDATQSPSKYQPHLLQKCIQKVKIPAATAMPSDQNRAAGTAHVLSRYSAEPPKPKQRGAGTGTDTRAPGTETPGTTRTFTIS